MRFTSAAQHMHQLQLRRIEKRGTATTTAATTHDLNLLKKWEQGDDTMYEAENLAARYSNRSNPQIRDALNAWWDAALDAKPAWQTTKQPSSSSWRGAAHRAVGKADHPSAMAEMMRSTLTQLMTRAEYDRIFLRIQKALLEEGDEWDLAEAMALLDEAWASDTNGRGDALRRTEFNDSLFELTDVWTNTTDPGEYVDFLRKLRAQVCGDSERPVWTACADTGHLSWESSILEREKRSSGQVEQRAAASIQNASRTRKAKETFDAQRSAAVAIQASSRRRTSKKPKAQKANEETSSKANTCKDIHIGAAHDLSRRQSGEELGVDPGAATGTRTAGGLRALAARRVHALAARDWVRLPHMHHSSEAGDRMVTGFHPDSYVMARGPRRVHTKYAEPRAGLLAHGLTHGPAAGGGALGANGPGQLGPWAMDHRPSAGAHGPGHGRGLAWLSHSRAGGCMNIHISAQATRRGQLVLPWMMSAIDDEQRRRSRTQQQAQGVPLPASRMPSRSTAGWGVAREVNAMETPRAIVAPEMEAPWTQAMSPTSSSRTWPSRSPEPDMPRAATAVHSPRTRRLRQMVMDDAPASCMAVLWPADASGDLPRHLFAGRRSPSRQRPETR